MNTLLLVAIVGVAAAALGLGSLNNEIILDVQDLGVGEETLTSPLDNADIDFVIARQSGLVSGVTETHNVIAACDLHVAEGSVPAGSTIYCKLTDIDGNVVAEGTAVNPALLEISDSINVSIDTADFPNNKVQNVHDVVIVVQGP